MSEFAVNGIKRLVGKLENGGVTDSPPPAIDSNPVDVAP